MGGAFLLDADGSLYTVDYCNFYYNNATNLSGGAIQHQKNSTLKSTNTKFLLNKAIISGGAIYNHGTANLALENMNFQNNIANKGSAIFHDGNSGFINKSRIVGNNINSSKHFDARYNWWGKNNVTDITSNVTVTNPIVFVATITQKNYYSQNSTTFFKVMLDVYHYNATGSLKALDRDVTPLTVTLSNNLGSYTINKRQSISFSLNGNQLNSNNILTATIDNQINIISAFKFDFIDFDDSVSHPGSNLIINATIKDINDEIIRDNAQVILKINQVTYQVYDLNNNSGSGLVTNVTVLNGNIRIKLPIPPSFASPVYNITLINLGHQNNSSLVNLRAQTDRKLFITPTKSWDSDKSENEVIETVIANKEEETDYPNILDDAKEICFGLIG